MKIQTLTLFPGMFQAVMGESIVGRAIEKGLLELEVINIRDYSEDKHRKTDDYPFGGGAGMVMTPQPVFSALEAVGTHGKRLIYMSPRGRALDQALVGELAREDGMVLLCGHYEGLDERVLSYFSMEEISLGDFILTGGELPAMALIDAVVRLLPGALGNPGAHEEESFCSGLLEYPQYTQPRVFRGMAAPETLVSGNHRLIRLWKFEESVKLTLERRPDLFAAFLARKDELGKDERRILGEYENFINLL
ncbi:MAG: tRNA (guanosine(37)-N1)-methyltransferase TrmD [Clostridiales Family XIII bacterium]|jgi:tRNA (guanine37-N1)-methyltransferase|nr:tRNA (guanosine(37)-N1)-methyltransferase TrmD [Clostridiales Family XIII bacterium]